MGTRAQVFMKETGVYLYQHWDGDGLESIVLNAIKSEQGQSRKNDVEYLTRIIFCNMIKNDVNGEIGYGIGNQMHGDIEYLITVDTKNQLIISKDVWHHSLKTYDFQGNLK